MKLHPLQIRIILWIIVILFICSCSERGRNNPLDPHNSLTQGKPTGLTVIAMERRVLISWEPLIFKNLQGVHIYRRKSGESAFTQIYSTRGTSYVDSLIHYGARYEYFITALAGDVESAPSDTVDCLPGPTFTWIADYQSGYVYCLTHDLRNVISSYGMLYYPRQVACSPKERAAWVSIRYEEKLFKIDHLGQLLATVPNMDHVVDIAVDTTTQNVWIAQTSPGRLIRLDSKGVLGASNVSLQNPVALAVQPGTANCWLLDGDERILKCFNQYGNRIFFPDAVFHNPLDLAVSSHNQKIWIADSSAIVQYDLAEMSKKLQVQPFFNVALLAYNEYERCLWAIDLESDGKPAKLLKMNDEGQILFSLAEFDYPYALTVNEFDGSCLVGDSGRYHYGVYRVSSDGVTIEKIGQFYSPLSIAVEYHK